MTLHGSVHKEVKALAGAATENLIMNTAHARHLVNAGSAAGSARTEAGRARVLVARELAYMAAERRDLARLLTQSAAYRAGALPAHLQALSDPATLRDGPARRFRDTARRLPGFRCLAARIPG